MPARWPRDWPDFRESRSTPDRVQTNIVIFDMARKDLDAAGLVLKLAGHGVKCFSVGPNRIRMVTHKDVDRAGILYALEVLETILQ